MAVALIGVAACSSCTNEDTPWGIEYSLTSDGQTDGSVNMTIVTGEFQINGNADYQFELSSDKALLLKGVKPLNEALACKDAKMLDAAERVNSWVDAFIKINSFEGNYDIYVKGYVKETKTGFVFSIDRHFTNVEEDQTVDFE